MQYTYLGRTGLKVSRLCLGTMNFGPETSEPDSFAIMDHAHELGINFFDTADVYGWKKGEGVTEQIIGRWFAQGGQRREKTVIATKLYGDMGDWPNTSRLSALHIKRACEGSLRRLQTDYIDLYQMHHIFREATWDEIWQALEQLVREGVDECRKRHHHGERGEQNTDDEEYGPEVNHRGADGPLFFRPIIGHRGAGVHSRITLWKPGARTTAK